MRMNECSIQSKRRRMFSIIFKTFVLIILCGCEPPHVLDETGLITVIGFDNLESKLIRGVASIPVVNSLANQKIQVVSGTGSTLRGILNDMDYQLDRKPRLGQMRVSLYSEEMAKNGIIDFVGSLDRTEVGSRPYLAVVRGKSYDMVNATFKEQGNIGLYLYYAIFKNVRGEQLPSPTLHEFLRAYYSDGSDPYLPYIERIGDDIKIRGLALFKNDRFVDWVNPHEAFYIKLIRDQFRTGIFETSLPKNTLEDKIKHEKRENEIINDIPIVFDTITSKTKIKLVATNPPKFDVYIKIHSRLSEIGQKMNLESNQVLDKIQRGVEKKMEQEMGELMKYLQKKEVDPIGFGEQYRAQTRVEELKKEEWRKRFKKAKFTFRVQNEIIRTTITD